MQHLRLIESSYSKVPPHRVNGRGLTPEVRPMLADSTTREIPLTKGHVAIVDASDYDFLSQFKWTAHEMRHTSYALRAVRYGGIQRVMYMHRYILLPDPEQEIDHANGNGLDNRRANLRIATRAEQMANRVPCGISRFKGVQWYAPTKRWRAEITKGSQYHYLGYFIDEVDAAVAYDAAARELHGEFAKLNFPAEVAR